MKLAAIITTVLALSTTGTLYALDANSNAPIVSAAEQTVAINSIDNVALAAVATYGLNGQTWPEELVTAINESGSSGSTTVSGTTITWSDGTSCFSADLPTPTTSPTVSPC